MKLASGDTIEVMPNGHSGMRVRIREADGSGYSVCKASAYLTPDELVAFGRECVPSDTLTDEVALAQRDAALKSLRLLVRQLERVQGYSTHEQQSELREARAVLAEAGQ